MKIGKAVWSESFDEEYFDDIREEEILREEIRKRDVKANRDFLRGKEGGISRAKQSERRV